MAKNKTKTKKTPKPKIKSKSDQVSNQQKLILGSFLVIFGILLGISFVSFFFTGNADQSTISNFTSPKISSENWLNKSGAWLSDFFINRGFGVSSFLFSILIFLSGIYILLNSSKTKLLKHWFWGILIIIWISVFFGFFSAFYDTLGGTIGFEINTFLQDYLGII